MRAHSRFWFALALILTVMGTIAPTRPAHLEILSMPDGKLGVLVYHRVLVNQGCSSVLGFSDVSEGKFTSDVDYLISRGYVFITFEDILQGNYDPQEKNIILTFDDGTGSHYDIVRPNLNSRGIRGVFYIVTGQVGQSGYLDWSKIQELINDGHEIGSHTVSHPELIDLTEEEIIYELFQSKATLESTLHGPEAEPYEVVSFVYPFCLHNDLIITLLEDNGWYTFAADCDLAYNSWENLPLEPFTLNRFPVTETFSITYYF